MAAAIKKSVRQLEDNELIKKFLTKADKRINRAQIVEDWRNALKEFSPPLETSEMLLFDESWIDAQFRRKHRRATLLRIMCNVEEEEFARSSDDNTIPLEVSGMSDGESREMLKGLGFNVNAADEGDVFLPPWDNVQSGLAHCTNDESDEASTAATKTIETVVQPTPYKEEMFSPLLEQSMPFVEDGPMQTTE